MLRVEPRARTTEILGFIDEPTGPALKVRVTAPPADGAANTAVVALLAKSLRIPKRDVEIVAGATSRRKRVRIHGLGADAVEAKLR